MRNSKTNLRMVKNDDGGSDEVCDECGSHSTMLSLRHVRKVHEMKSKRLGRIYTALGDDAWQMLCEIHLRNNEGIKIDISDVQSSLRLPRSLANRYLDLMRSENLVEPGSGAGATDFQDLRLTVQGAQTVDAILEESSTAHDMAFAQARPRPVAV